ncbi:hypothetical protein [Cyanobacterium sp. Dongsha4]|uniref:hypothetical protein n=1 Tax=Cyanobacterium sp. DS4 TaxID=2878255 RepID=UPI002E8230B8|nr:hypothetical protein [Cyanobacterium sp. Dongsha4]WVK99066.1 hypothetical protein Dongsha4_10165 [Cyanobacterium sp. Dongsha4]
MNIILFLLTNSLKIFGLFWIAGGLFVCIEVLKSSRMDKYIKAIDFNYKTDYQEYIFSLGIGLLTLLSGITLLIFQDSAILFLGLLIITQLMFFDFRDKKFKASKNDSDKEYYSISSQTYNAYLTSIYVTIFALIRYCLNIFVN